MSSVKMPKTELREKFLYLAALAISIELVFFKFIPDLGTAFVQGTHSSLADFSTYEKTYLAPGSVHHARFLGNLLLYKLAKWLGAAGISADIRLHPLRIAAAILTPLYACLGALPIFVADAAYNWRGFLIPYALSTVLGLYVFYPCDMPSLACLSIGLWLLLNERFLAALLCMLLAGLFRESAFHMVWFAGTWALFASKRPLPAGAAWTVAFAAAFVLEYLAIRHYFPGPISSAGALIWNPRELFFGKGIWTLTTLGSLSFAALFPALFLMKLDDIPSDDRRKRFFLLNCWSFPLWVIFYRAFNGNISEFRMLWPAVLPCVFGIAYAAGSPPNAQPAAARC